MVGQIYSGLSGQVCSGRERKLERLIAKLSKELPGMLADYEKVAAETDGALSPRRQKNIVKVRSLLEEMGRQRTYD
jgi:hypothetical protein